MYFQKNTRKERHPLPKCRLLSLLCSYQAVRSHSVSQETSTSSNTITLLVLLNSHFHLQAYRCFVTIGSLELSLQSVKNVMHFAGKGFVSNLPTSLIIRLYSTNYKILSLSHSCSNDTTELTSALALQHRSGIQLTAPTG